MDFDAAAAKLQSDHNQLRARARTRGVNKKLATSSQAMKLQKQQQYRQKQIALKRERELVEKKKLNCAQSLMDQVNRSLDFVLTKNDGAAAGGAGDDGKEIIMLEATSIHGQGDKISLPTSLLENQDLVQSMQGGQPLFFRLGIRREDVEMKNNNSYTCPASDSLKQLMEEKMVMIANNKKETIGNNDNNEYIMDNDDGNDEDMDDDEESEEFQEKLRQAYKDELAEKYVSYTYATVVDFNQDEGQIGIPALVAEALLRPKKKSDNITLESRLTVDPASVSSSTPTSMLTDDDNDDIDDEKESKNDSHMEIDNNNDAEETLGEKTPGHLAYGAFPVPLSKIEVSAFKRLPLGLKCTLQPTSQAIQDGFYGLKDIKLALEQSLIRYRGSLNVGDLVHCWHRGKKFDLNVKDVTPDKVGAVSCINTDLEVDFASADEGKSDDTIKNDENPSLSPSSTVHEGVGKGGGGYKLSDYTTVGSSPSVQTPSLISSQENKPMKKHDYNIDIPPEPPADQKEGVILIQLRGSARGKMTRRRFESNSTYLKDIFALALKEEVIQLQDNDDSVGNNDLFTSFQLVSSFPRRVFDFHNDGDKLLSDFGLSSREQFLVERKTS